MQSILRQQIAFRCPSCATATIGFIGRLHSVSDMLRLKCECGEYALEIKGEKDGRVSLNVPCVFCKDTHTFTISGELFSRDIPTMLPCPHSHHDILFIANENDMPALLERSAGELSLVLSSFEADELSDIQPMEVDDAEAMPDPAIYDVLNFVIRDLEADGKVVCPCKKGPYELRFTDFGAEAVCSSCGASYKFYAMSGASAESYLEADKIELT